MSAPTPGIQRQSTFSSIAHKVALFTKYGRLMLTKFRRTNTDGPRPAMQDSEMTIIHHDPPVSYETVRDVKWDIVDTEIRAAGKKHVLVNFYSPFVRTCILAKTNKLEQVMQKEREDLSTAGDFH
jgi:hypothetical protein